MFFLAPGFTYDEIQELSKKVLPILQHYGVKHESTTFIPLPAGVVVNPRSEVTNSNAKGLWFPAFDDIRDQHLHEVATAISKATGIPCTAIQAPVIAAVAGVLK